MSRLRFLILTAGLALLLCGCAAAPAPTDNPTVQTNAPAAVPTETSPLPAGTEAEDFISRLVDEMTLREKVGQLFIIRPDSLDLTLTQEQINDPKADGVTSLTDAMADTLKDYPAGGIVMFSKNITGPDQITAFHTALQTASDIPLFLAVDEEGGPVSRLANHKSFDLPQYESAAAVGSTGDTVQAFAMGSTIGSYLREYGFNMDFAPVADVNTNPDNPIIGTRAFSSDAGTAAGMAEAFAAGLRSQRIIAVFKHFPGHGDTAEDSHSGIAVSRKTPEELRTCEWLPFLSAGSGDFVMIGHIAVPSITDDLTPATLSSQIVTDILKTELYFQGLVITDSLAMEAITDEYSPGEAALGALQAGCDMLLMPNGFTNAFDAVIAAVEDGSFPETELDAIVERILRFKAAHGLLGAG